MKRATCGIVLFLSLGISAVRAQSSVSVLIVYYSKDGHTKSLADAVAKGARSVKLANVKMVVVADATMNEVLSADAIVLGSPVYNANVAPPIQEFINRWPFDGGMRDKIGAAFVSADGISAGEELVQTNILHSMLIFGMIVVGGGDWQLPFGASAVVAEAPFQKDSQRVAVADQFLRKAEMLGERVAEVAVRLKRAK